jgi:hypothetical protein
MAFTWSVLSNHDLSIRSGSLVIAAQAEEVRQRVLITLLHHWQEYFLNVPAGLPWYEFILGNKDHKLVGQLLRKTILKVPGVYSVINFQLDFTNASREFAIYADVETEYGIVSVIIDSP